MKLFLFFFLALSLFGSSVETRIKQKSRELYKTQKQIQGVNVKLSKLAKNIAALQKDLQRTEKKIAEVDSIVRELSKEYDIKLKELNATKKVIEILSSKHSKLKEELVLAISKLFSTSLLLNSIGKEDERGIVKEEILKSLQQKEEMRLKELSKEYSKTTQTLQQQQNLVKKLQQDIKKLLKKKSELKKLKQIKSKKMASLSKQKKKYDEELKNLVQQKNAIKQTLVKLNILKQESQRSKANVKVKKYGGYKKDKTVRYRGPKTIPPLRRFIIVKKYGVYKDPIYKIEIPNENIELKPLEPNAKVRNVLNGRIILAKWTPHLKNVVIVKHDGGLYTIYANMDKLAPFVKKGRRIKKGYIIGRVNSKLIFEVTKNSAHINPLDLIRVR